MRQSRSCIKCSLYLLLLFFFLCQRAAAQGFSQQFDALFIKEHPDTVQIRNLLRLWQRLNSDDPQLYVAAFNFSFSQSLRKSAVADSGYTEYDSVRVRNALAWIDQGISRFPDRLDMRFGKAHAQRLTHSFDSFLVTMQRVLDRSAENRNDWKWTGDTKLDSGRRYMLNSMQSYLRELYETQRDELLPVMSKLGAAVVAMYPEEVEVLTTTAVSLLLQKRFAEALAYLRRAERIRPQDVVVLNNLAETYRLMGDKKAAIQYLKAVETYGNAAQKEQARRQRKAL